jgi:rRNA maturation endonuclease Nob1
MTTATKPQPVVTVAPQAAPCTTCGRTFILISARQILAWAKRGDRCPRCGGAS